MNPPDIPDIRLPRLSATRQSLAATVVAVESAVQKRHINIETSPAREAARSHFRCRIAGVLRC